MYNDFFTTTATEKAADGFIEGLFALGGALLVLAIFLCLIAIAVVVLVVIACARINVKAGEKWWKALIPLYNTWIQTKIVGLAWHWFVIFVVLFAWTFGVKNANSVWSMALVLVSFNYNYNLAKKFGKSNSFAFWCTLLPVIFLPILGFGSAKYNKDAAVDENGVFSLKK